MIDHQDESLLAVAMYLLSRGESKQKITEMLVCFGWEENLAKRAIKDILVFLPNQKFEPRPSPVSVVGAWLTLAALILVFGDSLFILPDPWLWRIVAALSLSVLIPFIFVVLWTLFAMMWDKIDR